MAWKATGVAWAAFAPGTMRAVNIDGGTYLLVHLGTAAYALDGVCTHEGGSLADGTLDGPGVICPEHAAKFDVRLGAVLADPDAIVPPTGVADPLTAYRTRVVDGMLEVELD